METLSTNGLLVLGDNMTEQDEIVTIPKEILLISLVAQEHSLYNPKHQNYRNSQYKDVKWLEIADNVGWAETQCKAKWKAMRDQYCRELKRSKFNAKANVKWKFFKELEFLRPYALSRNYRPKTLTTNNNNNNIITGSTNTANNTTSFNTSNTLNSSGASNNSHSLADNKFPTIKIETATSQFNGCDFNATGGNNNAINNAAALVVTHAIKSEPVVTTTATARLLNTFTDEQLNSVMQQQDGSWNYLTATSTSSAPTAAATQSLTNNQQQQQRVTTADEVLYSTLVDCVNPTANQLQQQQHNAEEEDEDDPIHTFLNIESYFEKELIAMIQQDDILYNNYHVNYRNVKLKLLVWDEIARKLKKTVKQCRLKWKALRDQYIREHKRLRNRENAESLPRWKHYDALSFLQKFIKHKASEDTKNAIQQMPKIEMDTDMDGPDFNGNQQQASPLRTADGNVVQQQHQQVQALPSLSGPHAQQPQLQQQALQQQNTNNGICVVNEAGVDGGNGGVVATTDSGAASANGSDGSGGDVSAYDEMDYDNYIISDEPAVGDDDDMVDDDDDDADDDGGGGMDDTVPDAISAVAGQAEQDVVDQIAGKINNNQQHEPNDFTYPTHNTSSNNQQADDNVAATQRQQQQQQEQHMMSVSVALADAAAKLVQESQQQHQQQPQQQHQQTVSLAQAATTPPQHHQQQQQQQQPQQQQKQPEQQPQFSNNSNGQLSGGASLLISGVSPVVVGHASNGANTTIHANNFPNNHSNATAQAATATTTTTATQHTIAKTKNSSSGNHYASYTDDDEVGAFFKAVSMKIRNANMSPVAFTDLQIEILRVINGSLRNH